MAVANSNRLAAFACAGGGQHSVALSALAHTHRRPGQGQGRAEQQHTNGGEAGGFAQGPACADGRASSFSSFTGPAARPIYFEDTGE